MRRVIKSILKNIDDWVHDSLTVSDRMYFRRSSVSLPTDAGDTRSTLDAIHAYDISRFGSISLYQRIKVRLKNNTYTMYVAIRKQILSVLLHIFLFRDKVLGRKK